MKKTYPFFICACLGVGIMTCSAREAGENIKWSEKLDATDVKSAECGQTESPLMMFGREVEKKSEKLNNQHGAGDLDANELQRERSTDLEGNHSNEAQREDLNNSIEEEEEEEDIIPLTIEDFREAIANNPEATRFILTQQGGREVIEVRDDPNNHSDYNENENRAIMRKLKDLITARYSVETANNIASLNPTAFLNARALNAATITGILNGFPPEEQPGINLGEITPHLTTTEMTSFSSISSDSIFSRPAFLKEKEATGELIQRLVREEFKNRFANFRANHSDHYEKADTAWEKQLQSWHKRTKAHQEQQDAIALHTRAEQLLKAAKEAQQKPDETFLGKVAEYTGKAAVPLSYIPGPIPFGGVAHTIAEIADKVNQMKITFDENVANAAVQLAKKNKSHAIEQSQQADAHVAHTYQQAQEEERKARLQETITRREIATALQPPVMSFDEKAWHTWAEKLVPSNKSGQDHENLIQQIAEHGMSDPAWAADLVHAAWDWKTVNQDHEEEQVTLQASLKPLKAASEEAQKALKDAEEIQNKAQQKVDNLKYKYQLATQDHQKAKNKLEAKEISRTEFATSFQELQEACSLINHYNDELQEAFNELAEAEETTNLLKDNFNFAQETLARAQERIGVIEEHPLKAKLPFRLPRKIDAHVLTIEQVEKLEQQQAGRSKVSQKIKPPIMLQKAAEFLGRKLHEELEGKHFSTIATISLIANTAPSLITPTTADHARWKAMEQMEALSLEREKAVQLYEQSVKQHSSTTAPNKAELKTITEGAEEENEGSEEGYHTPEEEPNGVMSNFNNCDNGALLQQQSTSSRSRTASISSRSSNNSFKSAKSHDSRASRKSFSERMKRDFNGSDTSSVYSAQTARTSQSKKSNSSSRSQRSKSKSLPASQNLKADPKADLAEAEHLFKEAKEKWIKQVEEEAKRNGISIPTDPREREAFFEERKKEDAGNYAAWQEEREIVAKALGAVDQLKNWEANVTRWEARWEADKAHAEAKNLEELLPSGAEDLQLAKGKAEEFEAKWIALANLEESVKAQPDEERKKFAREKLEERDRAVKIFWEDFQEGYRHGAYCDRKKRVEERKVKFAQLAGGYKHDLLLERIKTIAECFAKADAAEVTARQEYANYLKTKDPQDFQKAQALYQLVDQVEEEARIAYAKTMREKALQDAVEKIAGASEAWHYLLNKALEEEATASMTAASHSSQGRC